MNLQFSSVNDDCQPAVVGVASQDYHLEPPLSILTRTIMQMKTQTSISCSLSRGLDCWWKVISYIIFVTLQKRAASVQQRVLTAIVAARTVSQIMRYIY